jgi:RHS repeat-associated protein
MLQVRRDRAGGGDAASEGTTNRLNEQLSYVYEDVGNLNYRTNNALVENFQVNNVNELTNNNNSGTLTVVGTTTTQNSNVVTVNGTNAQVYGDATFAAPNLPLTNSYTATASDSLGRRATNTVSVSIAANNALFQYDGNGNLIYDGLRSFAYDDENQLIQVCVSNQWLSQFVYDGKMRRRIRQECAWQGGVWVQTNEVYYVYDGNVVVQERDVNNLPTTTYTRGLDLSGSLQGAGGIGGLLARTSQAYADAPLAGQSYYHCDGNGNVTMLINDSQAIVAKYLYDAFGNILSKSGLLADANLYRFSSKEAHPNSGLVYYLYRYYDPNLQRWPNRDPIQEMGGVNLYKFVLNRPISLTDKFGLSACSDTCLNNLTSCLNQALFDAGGGGIIGVPIGIGLNGGFRGPGGRPRPFCRSGGLTGLGKGTFWGGLGGFAGGLFLGEWGCYSSYAGCLSGCPANKPPPPPPSTPNPSCPGPPDCNENAPPSVVSGAI